MRRLTFFLAAVLLVLVAEKAPCHEITFSIDPNDRNSLGYSEMRVEEADPLSIRRGRFLSVDPVLDMKRAMRQPQSWNRYSYVVNNPINRIDPDGRVDQNWDGGAAQQLFPDDRAAQLAFDQGVAEKTAGLTAAFVSAFIPGPEDVPLALLGATKAFRAVSRFFGRAAAASDDIPLTSFERASNRLANQLQFTNTTLSHMKDAGRMVPRSTLAQAIMTGARSADPQGAKGAIQITQTITKNGKDYVLKIIYREKDQTILHFHYAAAK